MKQTSVLYWLVHRPLAITIILPQTCIIIMSLVHILDKRGRSFKRQKETMREKRLGYIQKNRKGNVKSDAKTQWFEYCIEKTNLCRSESYEWQRYTQCKLVHFRWHQCGHQPNIPINHGHGFLWLYYSNHCSDWIDIKHFWDLFSFNWNQTRKNKQFTATQFCDF